MYDTYASVTRWQSARALRKHWRDSSLKTDFSAGCRRNMEIQYQSGKSKSERMWFKMLFSAEIAVMTETIKERFLRKDDLDRCRLKIIFKNVYKWKKSRESLKPYVLTVASEIPEFVYRMRNACFLVIFFFNTSPGKLGLEVNTNTYILNDEIIFSTELLNSSTSKSDSYTWMLLQHLNHFTGFLQVSYKKD